MTDLFEIKDNTLIKYNGSDRDVKVPEGVMSIAPLAFNEQKTKIVVTLPRTLKEIDQYAFPEGLVEEFIVYNEEILTELPNDEGNYYVSFCEPDTGTVIWQFYYCPEGQTSPTKDDLWDFFEGGVGFKYVDSEVFKHLKNIKDRIRYALTRLEYPYDLTEENRKQYQAFLKRNGHKLLEELIDSNNKDFIVELLSYDVLTRNNVEQFIQYSASKQKVEITVLLMELKEKNAWSTKSIDFGLSEKVPEVWETKEDEPDRIRRYRAYESRVIFPVEHNGISITGLADVSSTVPENYKQLTEIIIPDGYTTLGKNAFRGCENLVSVHLPDSLVTISDHCFEDCVQLKEIVIPDNVREIGGFAFKNCNRLESITLSKELTTIGSCAFEDCNALTCIDLPEKVKELGPQCFYRTGLRTVIYRGAECSSPEKMCFYYPRYVYTDGKINALGIPASIQMPLSYLGLKVEKLAETAGRDFLKGLTITGYSGLKAFPKDIKNCFKGMEFREFIEKLGGEYSRTLNKKVNILVTYQIDKENDYIQKALAQGTAVIDEKVFLELIRDKKSIDLGQFRLQEAYTEGIKKKTQKTDKSNPFRPAEIKKNWSFEKDENDGVIITDYKGTDTVVQIPERVGDTAVTALGDNMFSTLKPRRREDRSKFMATITEIKIPETVKKIGVNAFYGCKALQAINLPEGLQIIEDALFEGCLSLEKIDLPDSLLEIGRQAFKGCENLRDIRITDRIKLGAAVFLGCDALADKEGLIIKNQILFGYCGAASKLEIPETVVRISQSAFSGTIWKRVQSNLQSIAIPDSVKSIDAFAFYGCDQLKDLYIENQDTEIDDYAFHGCEGIAGKDGFIIIRGILFGYCGQERDVTIPNHVERIASFSINRDNRWIEKERKLILHIPERLERISGVNGWVDKVIFAGKKGSAAEKYAKEHHLEFRIDD